MKVKNVLLGIALVAGSIVVLNINPGLSLGDDEVINDMDKSSEANSDLLEEKEDLVVLFENKAKGIALYQEKKYEKALDYLLASIHPEIPDIETYLYIAYCFAKLGERAHSTEVLEKAASLLESQPSSQADSFSPVEESIYLQLAENYQKAGNNQQALLHLREGYERNTLSLKLFEKLLALESDKALKASLLEKCNRPILMRAEGCQK